jgi:hypothetical protein
MGMSQTKVYNLLREIALPRATVWRLLSNTDHLNRVLGLLPVHYDAVSSDGISTVRAAHSRIGNAMSLRWDEHPFEWSRERSYSVRRDFTIGRCGVAAGAHASCRRATHGEQRGAGARAATTGRRWIE